MRKRTEEGTEKPAGKLKRCPTCDAPEHPARLAHVFGQAAAVFWPRKVSRKSRSL